MASCIRCGNSIAGFETILVTGRGEFCYPCYNEDLPKTGAIRFDNTRLDPVTLQDAQGKPHSFLVQSRLAPTGHAMRAIEVRDGESRGYLFEVVGDFEDDAMVLFGKLYQRMREGLAAKHVEDGPYGWQLTKAHRLSARIECDLGADDRLPLLVIDGKEFAWDEVGRMLMSFEGFTVEMAVRDTMDVVGGPLLEEDNPPESD